MPLFVHELLCVDASGNVSTVQLTIEDDDLNLASGEVDAVYTLDGDILATTPAVDVGQLALTYLDGTVGSSIGMHFLQGGNDYYMFADAVPADAVASTGGFTSFGEVGGIAYTGYGFIESEVLRPYQGLAFLRSAAGAGPITDDGVSTITVYDDDNAIDLTAETGGAAQGHVGYQGQEGPFSNAPADPVNGIGPSTIKLVEVAYTGGAGAGTFEAIEFTFIRFGTTYYAYVPRSGVVDMADVTAITGVTILAGSVDGDRYADFGLKIQTTVVDGTGADELLSGTWLHDRFNGLGGADTLVGSLGEDKLYGDGGGDDLYGGMHADTLYGGGGKDDLYGRSQDDVLIGGNGADSLYGGWNFDQLAGGDKGDLLQGNQDGDVLTGGNGDDTLEGGAGVDTLLGDDGDDLIDGGSGADSLTDGAGTDTLTGGAGADTFLFNIDGQTDTIVDFKDGTDLVGLEQPFTTLTITDIAPGEVHILHGGDLLILRDTSGNLTAADIGAADFI